MSIQENLSDVKSRIEAAARKVGRDPAEITLVAVSKTLPADYIKEAAEAGQVDFGENYVQELRAKAEELDGEELRWHFIGHLQRNKVKYLPGMAHLIHSVDSPELAKEIAKQFAKRGGHTADVLVEVNVAGEMSKAGIDPEGLQELLKELDRLPELNLQGLMTMPPFADDPEDSRPYFKTMVELRDNYSNSLGLKLKELSMGMSSDYEVAVEEGATIVRVGTAIFGSRS